MPILWCAGVVMLVKGSAVPGGDFHVRDVRYAGMAPQAPLPPPSGTILLPCPVLLAMHRYTSAQLEVVAHTRPVLVICCHSSPASMPKCGTQVSRYDSLEQWEYR